MLIGDHTMEILQQLEFLKEHKRLETFNNWVFSENHACSPQKMAEAGFIFIGNSQERDVAKCFLCDKTLDGWEETDDPWVEHLNHSPNCYFAQKNTPEIALTLAEYIGLRDKLFESILKRHFDKAQQSIDEKYENAKNQTKFIR